MKKIYVRIRAIVNHFPRNFWCSHHRDVKKKLWDVSPGKKNGETKFAIHLRNNEKKVQVLSEVPLFIAIFWVPDLAR